MFRRIGMGALAAILALLLALTAAVAPATAAPGFVAGETLSSVGVDGPALAMAPNGYAIVAWTEVPAGDTLVRVSLRPPGGSWSPPQTLVASPETKNGLEVAVDSAGDAAIAWAEFPVTGSAAYVATRPAGGAFGAAESLGARTLSPAVGVDGSGRVTLVHTERPAVVARDFQVGGSALAAPARTLLSSACEGGFARLAVAPSGDALAGYECHGAAFALRRGGAWTASPLIADTPASACDTDISHIATSVAIDAAGHPVGVLRTDTTTRLDTGLGFCLDLLTTSEATLVLPLGDSMEPLPGPPAAMGVGPSGDGLSAPQAGISPAGVLFVWGDTQTTGRAVVKASTFATDGSGGSAEQTVSTTPSLGFLEPVLGVAADGRALLAWYQQDRAGAEATVVAAERPPGGAFGPPVPVSSGPDVGFPEVASSATGDGLVVWKQGSLPYAVRARGFDASPPALSGVAIPSSMRPRQREPFAASAFDLWGPVRIAWSFGDGAVGRGASVRHAYASAGSYTATVTATDAVGNAVSQSGTVTVQAAGALAPRLTGASLTHRRFRVGGGRTAVGARRRGASRAPVGTTFVFTLDRAASVRIAFARRAHGLRSGRRCAQPSRRLRRAGARRCTRLVAIGPALTRSLPAGANAVPFSGRIGRRALAPGAYGATLTPSASGRAGAPSRLAFRVLR